MESHPNVSPEILAAIETADGAVDVRDLPEGYALEVETRNTVYRINGTSISSMNGSRPAGTFHGSNFGGSMYSPYRVWVGGFMEFGLGDGKPPKVTSVVERIDVVKV